MTDHNYYTEDERNYFRDDFLRHGYRVEFRVEPDGEMADVVSVETGEMVWGNLTARTLEAYLDGLWSGWEALELS